MSKFFIKRPGEYWTGKSWSTLERRAETYDFQAGLAVIEKRFHRQDPVPKLSRVKDPDE